MVSLGASLACREVGLRSNPDAPASRGPYSQQPTYTRKHGHGLIARHGSRGRNATRLPRCGQLPASPEAARSEVGADRDHDRVGRERRRLAPASVWSQAVAILKKGAERGASRRSATRSHRPRKNGCAMPSSARHCDDAQPFLDRATSNEDSRGSMASNFLRKCIELRVA